MFLFWENTKLFEVVGYTVNNLLPNGSGKNYLHFIYNFPESLRMFPKKYY